MTTVVLEVNDLNKRFKVYKSPWARIREWLTLGRKSYHRDFWAIRDVSFKVQKGEFLGILGPNGAGKSTLLKLITGVLDATSGSFNTTGRVLSLLELNGGMDDSLTGRENIIRSTQLLGIPDEYARERMDEIIEFSELGEFFDRALETYSSGMRVRLAFSMFAFLECDILILDEILAVGDIFFRQKCYARLEELIKKNVAIILVTQSTGIVNRYCQEVIVMNKGKIAFQGPAEQATQKYFEIKNPNNLSKIKSTYIEEDYLPELESLRTGKPQQIEWPPQKIFEKSALPATQNTQSIVDLIEFLTCNEGFSPKQVYKQGEKMYVYMAFQAKENMGVPIVETSLKTVNNIMVFGKNILQENLPAPLSLRIGDIIRVKHEIQMNLRPGNYVLGIKISTMHPEEFLQMDALTPAELGEKMVQVANYPQSVAISMVPADVKWAPGLHNGVCNLPGEMSLSVLKKEAEISPF